MSTTRENPPQTPKTSRPPSRTASSSGHAVVANSGNVAGTAVAYEPFPLLGPYLQIAQSIGLIAHAGRTVEEAFVQIVCQTNNLSGSWKLSEDGTRLMPMKASAR